MVKFSNEASPLFSAPGVFSLATSRELRHVWGPIVWPAYCLVCRVQLPIQRLLGGLSEAVLCNMAACELKMTQFPPDRCFVTRKWTALMTAVSCLLCWGVCYQFIYPAAEAAPVLFCNIPISCPRRAFCHSRAPLSPPPQYRQNVGVWGSSGGVDSGCCAVALWKGCSMLYILGGD